MSVGRCGVDRHWSRTAVARSTGSEPEPSPVTKSTTNFFAHQRRWEMVAEFRQGRSFFLGVCVVDPGASKGISTENPGTPHAALPESAAVGDGDGGAIEVGAYHGRRLERLQTSASAARNC